MATTMSFFLLLQEIRCEGLSVHLVGVGVGELACFLFVFLFLLSSSPILHLALIGLVAFFVARSKPRFVLHQASSLP